ncbi:MAG: hypothetical protein GX379_09835 [Clostridiales bacterium]|jgi:heme/copper-type cytochrome/quinol oxidase subunit 4|nr:hypothetical protein [Clostridiales bacterium]
MPTIWDDLLIIMIFLVPFLLIQIFLSIRKRIIWGFVIPILWTVLGVWMIISNRRNESSHIPELILFYLIGDLIFIGILFLIKHLRKRSHMI